MALLPSQLTDGKVQIEDLASGDHSEVTAAFIRTKREPQTAISPARISSRTGDDVLQSSGAQRASDSLLLARTQVLIIGRGTEGTLYTA